MISFRSMLSVRRTRQVGSRYLEDTKYNFEYSPEISPTEFSTEGMK
jgi:hypothetical protein